MVSKGVGRVLAHRPNRPPHATPNPRYRLPPQKAELAQRALSVYVFAGMARIRTPVQFIA